MAKIQRRQNQAKFDLIINGAVATYKATLPGLNSAFEQVLSYMWKNEIRKRAYRQLVRCSERMRARLLREIVEDIAREIHAAADGLKAIYGAV